MANLITRKPGQVSKRAEGDPLPADAAVPAEALQQVVAEASTDQAAALAAQIEALQTQIEASQGAIAAKALQIEALANQTAEDGSPIDNTALIQAAEAERAQMEASLGGMVSELTALQDALAAINAQADATGGTPTEEPPPASTEPVMDANGMPVPPAVTAAAQAMRAASALVQMRGTLQTHLLPYLPAVNGRTVTAAQRSKIAADANDLIRALHNVVGQAGGVPVRALRDQNIMFALEAEVREPVRFDHVRSLINRAHAGDLYRQELTEACVQSRVRTAGAGEDVTRYRTMLNALTIEQLRDEAYSQDGKAARVWSAGRSVTPASAVAHDGAGNGATGGNGSAPGKLFGKTSRDPFTP